MKKIRNPTVIEFIIDFIIILLFLYELMSRANISISQFQNIRFFVFIHS